MAKLHLLSVVILFSLFLVQRSLCADPLEISPNPSTDLAADSPPSPPPDAAGAPLTSPPAGATFTSPPTSSPLAPPPSDLSPSPPANSTSKKTQTPALSPADHTSKKPSTPVNASDISHENEVNANGDDSSGLKGGQRAGIVIGVIISACVVGFVAMVYQKRQKNLRRSQYRHAVRGDFL